MAKSKKKTFRKVIKNSDYLKSKRIDAYGITNSATGKITFSQEESVFKPIGDIGKW